MTEDAEGLARNEPRDEMRVSALARASLLARGGAVMGELCRVCPVTRAVSTGTSEDKLPIETSEHAHVMQHAQRVSPRSVFSSDGREKIPYQRLDIHGGIGRVHFFFHLIPARCLDSFFPVTSLGRA